jgi:hypothetical protein
MHFVTWRLARGQEELDSDESDLVMAAMKRFDGQRYELAASSSWTIVFMCC